MCCPPQASGLISLPFRIDESRGSQVLVEVLGEEFEGVIGCDYFSAYRKYMGDFGVGVTAIPPADLEGFENQWTLTWL